MQIQNLKNGAKILFINKKTDIIYLEISFFGGLFSAPIEKQQIPHILEHLILQNFTPKNGEFRKNGHTNNLITTFSFEVSHENFSETLSKFIKLFEDFDFSEKDLQIQKDIIKNELLSRSKSQKENLYTKILKSQDIPALSESEQIETLSNINHQDILSYYRQNFVSNNLRILVVGDFDKDHILNKFNNINLENNNPKILQNHNLKSAKKLHKNEKLCNFIRIFATDRKLNTSERTAISLISNELRTKIYQKIRKNGDSYQFGGFFSEGSVFENSFLAFDVEADIEKITDIDNIIKGEIDKIQKINENNLREAKERFRNKLAFETQTSAQMAQNHRIRFFTHGDFVDFEKELQNLNAEKVQKIAHEFLSDNKS